MFAPQINNPVLERLCSSTQYGELGNVIARVLACVELDFCDNPRLLDLAGENQIAVADLLRDVRRRRDKIISREMLPTDLRIAGGALRYPKEEERPSKLMLELGRVAVDSDDFRQMIQEQFPGQLEARGKSVYPIQTARQSKNARDINLFNAYFGRSSNSSAPSSKRPSPLLTVKDFDGMIRCKLEGERKRSVEFVQRSRAYFTLDSHLAHFERICHLAQLLYDMADDSSEVKVFDRSGPSTMELGMRLVPAITLRLEQIQDIRLRQVISTSTQIVCKPLLRKNELLRMSAAELRQRLERAELDFEF